MSQYVLARIIRLDNVDLGLFDWDRNNTLYFFFLNADEQIYMRYGGRDSQSQDTYLNLNSLELALQKGLDLHEQYKKGIIPPKPRPKSMFAKEFPLLVERTFAKGNCVECHLTLDYQNQHRELDGTLNKPLHMYRSPELKTLGISLDVPKGLLIKEASGPARDAGLLPGDLITRWNNTPVYTYGDWQYQHDKLPRDSAQVPVTVERQAKPVQLTLNLPVRWWVSDIRWRQFTVDPRTYFDSTPLSPDEKKQLNLNPNGFASRVTHIDAFAEMVKSHALKRGDIVFAVNGKDTDPIANTAELFIKLYTKAGDDVTIDVLRGAERIRMPLKTFRMSFRK